MAQDVKKAFQVLVEVRKELQPLLEFPDDKTETAKEERKKKLLEIKKTLKTKQNFAIAEAQKVYGCSVALLLARRECNRKKS